MSRLRELVPLADEASFKDSLLGPRSTFIFLTFRRGFNLGVSLATWVIFSSSGRTLGFGFGLGFGLTLGFIGISGWILVAGHATEASGTWVT